MGKEVTTINTKIIVYFCLLSLLSVAFISSGKVALAATNRRALSDVNRDGLISLTDLNLIRDNYLKLNPVGIAALSDVNQDEVVNILDISQTGKLVGQQVSACEMADLNLDWVVNRADMNILNRYLGQTVNSVTMPADITGDGIIDNQDVTQLTSQIKCHWSILVHPPPASPF